MAETKVHVYIETLKHGNDAARSLASKELSRIGEMAVLPLCEVLKEEDSFARFFATMALRQIKDSRAVGPLCSLLTDKNWYVRYFAAKALGQIRTQSRYPAV